MKHGGCGWAIAAGLLAALLTGCGGGSGQGGPGGIPPGGVTVSDLAGGWAGPTGVAAPGGGALTGSGLGGVTADSGGNITGTGTLGGLTGTVTVSNATSGTFSFSGSGRTGMLMLSTDLGSGRNYVVYLDSLGTFGAWQKNATALAPTYTDADIRTSTWTGTATGLTAAYAPVTPGPFTGTIDATGAFSSTEGTGTNSSVVALIDAALGHYVGDFVRPTALPNTGVQQFLLTPDRRFMAGLSCLGPPYNLPAQCALSAWQRPAAPSSVPVVYDPYATAHQLWSKEETGDLSDANAWQTVTVPSVPEGATAVILNLRGRARGIGVSDRTRVRLQLRTPGAADPAHRVLRVNAQRDTPSTRQQNLVCVPLGSGNTIELWYVFELSGSANDQARARVFVQGFLRGGIQVYTPYDTAKALFAKTLSDDLSDAGTWQTLTLTDVPTGARAVLLNLHGRVRGFGLGPSQVRLLFKKGGSTVPPTDPSASMRVSAVGDAANRNKNAVFVELGPGNTIDYLYELDAGGSLVDEARFSSFVQGYLTDTWPIYDPGDRTKVVLEKTLADDLSDADAWQTVTLSGAPASARAALLFLTGGTTGLNLAGASSEVHVWARKPGSAEPYGPALRINAMSPVIRERGNNLVIVELNSTDQIELKYTLTSSMGGGDLAQFGVYLHGWVTE